MRPVPSVSPASAPQLRRATRGKEAILLFLAFFYFLIATNTQSGWLFLLSAFLLGLLATSWLPPRRAAGQVSFHRELVGSPRRGEAVLLRVSLSNLGRRTLREVLVVGPAQPWALEQGEFRWVVPRLEPGETASTEYSLTAARRGEHVLSGARLRFGAPFGLFAVTSVQPDSEPFLVYPRLLTLPPRRQRTRLAGILTEFTSPRSKGDSRSLRSLREYQSGDDLRLVHWKSSAKTGGTTLLVREHHAPSRQISVLLLDTSARATGEAGEQLFEKAVMLAASLLWSAHRAGTRSTLLLQGDSGDWQRLTRWEEQFTGLARVAQNPRLPFPEWMAAASKAAEELPETRMGAHPFIVTAASSPEELGQSINRWPGAACLLVAPVGQASLFGGLGVTVVDAEDGHAGQALEGV